MTHTLLADYARGASFSNNGFDLPSNETLAETGNFLQKRVLHRKYW